MSKELLQNALLQLDTESDNHWTADGLPRLDTVKFISGVSNVTRADLTAAAPGFSRAVPAFEMAQPGNTPEPAIAPPVPPAEPPAVEPVPPAIETPEVPEGVMQVEAVEPEKPVVDTSGLEQQLAAVREEMGVKQLQRDQLSNELLQLAAKEAQLAAEVEEVSPAESSQEAIQSYPASQRKVLQTRGERITHLRKEGITQQAVFGGLRAPIDDALAAKNRQVR